MHDGLCIFHVVRLVVLSHDIPQMRSIAITGLSIGEEESIDVLTALWIHTDDVGGFAVGSEHLIPDLQISHAFVSRGSRNHGGEGQSLSRSGGENPTHLVSLFRFVDQIRDEIRLQLIAWFCRVMDFVDLFVRPIRVGGVHKFGFGEVLLDKLLHAGRQCQHLLVLVLVQIDGICRCHHVLQLSLLRIGVLRKQQPRAFFSDIHGLESPLFAVIKVKEFCYISVAGRCFFI